MRLYNKGVVGWVIILLAVFIMIALLSIGEPEVAAEGKKIVEKTNFGSIYTTVENSGMKNYGTLDVIYAVESDKILDDDASIKLSSGSLSNLFSSESIRKSFLTPSNKLDGVTNVKLEFNVKEAAGDGYIQIMVGNNTIFSKEVLLGKVLVNFDPANLTDYNIISMEAKSKGLNFLEETKYIIENMTLYLEKASNKPQTRTFSLTPDEYKKFASGKIQFYTRNGNGKELKIKVNDETVYVGTPTEGGIYYSTEFSKVINSGVNNIIFETEKGGDYTLNEVLFKYTLGKKKTKDIIVPLTDVTNTTKLKVTVEVIEKTEDASVLVTISNSKGQKTNSIKPEIRDNNIVFESEYLTDGDNTLTFSSTDKHKIGKVTVYRIS